MTLPLLGGCADDSLPDQAAALLAGVREADGEPTAIQTINDATVDALPDAVTVTGVVDEDGDGFDDDGLVSLTTGGEWVCVELPHDGSDGSVTEGACS